jgi:hypothetical protein
MKEACHQRFAVSVSKLLDAALLDSSSCPVYTNSTSMVTPAHVTFRTCLLLTNKLRFNGDGSTMPQPPHNHPCTVQHTAHLLCFDLLIGMQELLYL